MSSYNADNLTYQGNITFNVMLYDVSSKVDADWQLMEFDMHYYYELLDNDGLEVENISLMRSGLNSEPSVECDVGLVPEKDTYTCSECVCVCVCVCVPKLSAVITTVRRRHQRVFHNSAIIFWPEFD